MDMPVGMWNVWNKARQNEEVSHNESNQTWGPHERKSLASNDQPNRSTWLGPFFLISRKLFFLITAVEWNQQTGRVNWGNYRNRGKNWLKKKDLGIRGILEWKMTADVWKMAWTTEQKLIKSKTYLGNWSRPRMMVSNNQTSTHIPSIIVYILQYCTVKVFATYVLLGTESPRWLTSSQSKCHFETAHSWWSANQSWCLPRLDRC